MLWIPVVKASLSQTLMPIVSSLKKKKAKQNKTKNKKKTRGNMMACTHKSITFLQPIPFPDRIYQGRAYSSEVLSGNEGKMGKLPEIKGFIQIQAHCPLLLTWTFFEYDTSYLNVEGLLKILDWIGYFVWFGGKVIKTINHEAELQGLVYFIMIL